VIEHFKSGKLEVGDMVTHQFSFMEIANAIKLIENPDINKGKVILTF
jgi:threonine dehydrogenase-like Zn-dependent dehydrogenase